LAKLHIRTTNAVSFVGRADNLLKMETIQMYKEQNVKTFISTNTCNFVS